MEVYLPEAGVQINIILILFASIIVGFLSGLFGVAGVTVSFIRRLTSKRINKQTT